MGTGLGRRTHGRASKGLRRRLVAGALVAATGAAVAFVALSAHPGNPLGPPARAEAHPATPAPSPPPASPAPKPGTARLAAVRGLTLYVPGKKVSFVGYHEAATDVGLALGPFGRCAHNYNRTKFRAPSRSPGLSYVVMSSRGRPNPATSAADAVMPAKALALSPVTGVVANVKRYRLYNTYRDYRISISPTGRPDLRVIVIHLDGLLVGRGSVLFAGVTPLGRPHVFPFRSQVNDYVGPNIPHIHVEVKVFGT